MRQLSSIDAAFWFAETRRCPPYGASLMICDPTQSPEFGFDAVRNRLNGLLDVLPPLRYRVTGHRYGLDRPWFVSDPQIDIDNHLRRATVPAPGGRRELDNLVGQLLSYPLGRDSVLWQAWYIEGAPRGLVAMLIKVHHALVDGVSGTSLFEALLDTSPHPAPVARGAAHGEPDYSLPPWAAREGAAAANLATLPYRLVRVVGQLVAQRAAVRGLPDRPPRLYSSPRTRFNTAISARRRIGASRVRLDRVHAVRGPLQAKFNDVVLALVSGALRRYLLEHDELPHRQLTAQIPISTHTEDSRASNQMVSTTVGLATDLADPARRICRIRANTRGAKQAASVMAAHQSVGLTELVPPGLLVLAVRAYTASGLGRRLAPFNVVISNIAGPQAGLYLAGASVEHQVPLGPLMMDVGLNVTCFSYGRWLEFGFVTTPEIADDVEQLACAVEPALRDLEHAAGLPTPC